MNRIKLSRIILVLALLPSIAPIAQATTIDFGPSFGAPATNVVLTDQLSDYGIVFSSDSPNGVVWVGPDGLGSFPYVIHAGFTGPFADTSPIRIDFSAAAISVSIRALDGGGDLDTVILSGFNSSGLLLATQTVGPDPFTFPAGNVLEIQMGNLGAFDYVVLETHGTQSGVFFDDLSFHAIPEPSACFLFAAGLLFISRRVGVV